MNIRHPFERIPSAARRRVFLPTLAAALLILLVWVLTVAPMSTDEAPLSVSSFGTAWSLDRAREMMAPWDERARLSGAFGIGFDFLNLVTYSTAVAMACAWLAQAWREAGRTTLANVWALMAWGQWLAVLCGVVQNAVMMSLLLGSGGESWLKISYWATLLKLALLILGPAFALAGWAVQTAAGDRQRR
jgi:hypothetical protein